MTWIAWLSLALIPLTIGDRVFHSFRFWWAPIFGLGIQLPWVVYGVALGREGLGCWLMAITIAGVYVWNMRTWLHSRKGTA